MIDDRGNVVDINGLGNGRIDREAEPLEGLDRSFAYGWIGDKGDMQTAIDNGYENELAIAIICELLRANHEGAIVTDKLGIDFLSLVLG